MHSKARDDLERYREQQRLRRIRYTAHGDLYGPICQCLEVQSRERECLANECAAHQILWQYSLVGLNEHAASVEKSAKSAFASISKKKYPTVNDVLSGDV
ncbi:hypothetical protein C2S51_008712 [Perilla frutescens var. frutescens]|nr:hypothetical protein C2S51_008712 [Perilla frutescens var. frutescens]